MNQKVIVLQRRRVLVLPVQVAALLGLRNGQQITQRERELSALFSKKLQQYWQSSR